MCVCINVQTIQPGGSAVALPNVRQVTGDRMKQTNELVIFSDYI
jgi:hypothetical protein